MKHAIAIAIALTAACQGQPESIQWETYDVICDAPGPFVVTAVASAADIFSASIRVDTADGISQIGSTAVIVDDENGEVVVGCDPQAPYQIMLGIRRTPNSPSPSPQLPAKAE